MRTLLLDAPWLGWAFFLAAGTLFMLLTLPNMNPLGRWIMLGMLCIGALGGMARDAATAEQDDEAPLSVGLALMVLSAIASTRGRPWLLFDGEMRQPPVEEARSVKIKRQLAFGLTLVVVLSTWLYFMIE